VVGFAAQTFQNDAIVVGGKTFLSSSAKAAAPRSQEGPVTLTQQQVQ
jgi:hypothetical protein